MTHPLNSKFINSKIKVIYGSRGGHHTFPTAIFTSGIKFFRNSCLILNRTALKSAGTLSDYARFHHLNDLAKEICNTTDTTLLNTIC